MGKLAHSNLKLMKTESKLLWIQKGYELIAKEGIAGLKIEPLAKEIGISKSSFYHLFIDLENFLEQLLDYHLEQSKILSEKELNCKRIDPDLIEVLVFHKLDLLFNRQLRIHRDKPKFNDALNKSNSIVGESFVIIWMKDLNLRLSPLQMQSIFELALENFFLQITFENLNIEWLSKYFENLKRITQNLV
ncbi:TetR/AcrR family transcriptional regulator [Leptospira sp. GIMC2001]|uniref:TetR/AcrR family transcriptional regulator n=1 Tax=Leptospira sp. GIMC2001 TaxID=1513297 RepID=UPI00234902B6|nr:TetR/AcrR family transcriptional regulator [Leptospira sp. GIMC2001]WCL49890.1 TetR/AcrR family transcriptional regulator [Leptospira sp. GIMC2001]